MESLAEMKFNYSNKTISIQILKKYFLNSKFYLKANEFIKVLSLFLTHAVYLLKC